LEERRKFLYLWDVNDNKMNRPEFKQDVNELYTFFANLLADGEPYGIEWHIHNVEVAIDHLNKFIESHPKTLQQ